MKWFPRRHRRPAWAAAMSDDDFQFFRAEVESILAEHGRAYVWEEPHGLRIDPELENVQIAGLERIARRYAATPHHAREELLRRHFSIILDPPKPPATWDEAAPSVRVGLRPRSYISEDPSTSLLAVREVADDLVAILYFQDSAENLVTISADTLADWNEPREGVWSRALENVHSETLAGDRSDELDSGGTVRALFGMTSVGAARALELERYVPEVAGHGSVVAVPNLNLVMAHAINEPPALASACLGMASTAAVMFNDEEEEPLSPHLYWRRGHQWIRLTDLGADGELRWDVPPEFEELAGRPLAP